MSEDESYLRWLARHLAGLPRALKSFAVGIIKVMPFIEFTVGGYSMLFGIVGIFSEVRFSSGHLYRFLGLSRFQWGFVVLIGFFLLTHGIYRVEKERLF